MSCSTNASWATTPAGYALANTDTRLAAWWGGVPHNYFAKQLAESSGDQPTWFDCGIGKVSSCTIAGCQAYVDAKDEPWTYEAATSVVNLNAYFNDIYTGVTNGQLDYTNEIQSLATTFMPPSDPTFPLGDGAPWITAVLTIIFTLGLFIDPAMEFAGVATGALLTGAVATADNQLAPGPASDMLDVADMENYAQTFGQSTRNMITDWANTTFLGLEDSANQTIMDYMKGGAFIDSTALPSPRDIEAFYMKQMISRTVNERWKTEQVYGTFTQTNDSTDASGPNQTRYYSAQDGGVYYTYQFIDDGRMNSHRDKPQGLDSLNGSYYGISGNDISKASAGAFRAAGFNYTQAIATQQLQKAIESNGSISPIEDGAAWQGTWTIAICDTGTHNWNSQYGDTSSGYGKLPCCCGPNCKDTAAFLRAANLNGSQTLLRGCSQQLKGTDLNFTSIDYGYPWQNSFAITWAGWSNGVRAGFAIAIIVASVLALLLISCCLSCLG